MTRSRLNWIRRRARRLMHFFNVSRHVAVQEAFVDWDHFNGARS